MEKNQINFWGNNCRKRFLSWAEWKWEFECSLPSWEFWKSFKKKPKTKQKRANLKQLLLFEMLWFALFPLWNNTNPLVSQTLGAVIEFTKYQDSLWLLGAPGIWEDCGDAPWSWSHPRGSGGEWRDALVPALTGWKPWGAGPVAFLWVPRSLGYCAPCWGEVGLWTGPLPSPLGLGPWPEPFTRVFAAGAVSQEQLSVWALGCYSFHTGHQTWTAHLGPCFKWREYARQERWIFLFQSLLVLF